MSLLRKGGAPYLERLTLLPERVASFEQYPYSVPVIRALDLRFRSPVTFLVGENGSGKSTLVEAIAGVLKLPIVGGGSADAGLGYGPRPDHQLSQALRPSFRRRPPDAYFFRSEFTSHFATLLDERKADRFFDRDPYAIYGGKSLFEQSHGESFLAIMQNRIGSGCYLLDEPEAALSPQRQLVLMALLADRRESGAQFIIATHSPLLMTIPDADILLIEGSNLRSVNLEDTEHYQVTRAVLQNPASFWKHLKS